jgi:hypothetical protein
MELGLSVFEFSNHFPLMTQYSDTYPASSTTSSPQLLTRREFLLVRKGAEH